MSERRKTQRRKVERPTDKLTPEEWKVEEWRRTCALTYDDIIRICGLSADPALADLVRGELP